MIRAAADFGFKVYYGDGTRLDMLRAAGAGEASAIVVCVDDREAADRIVELVQGGVPAGAGARALLRPRARARGWSKPAWTTRSARRSTRRWRSARRRCARSACRTRRRRRSWTTSAAATRALRAGAGGRDQGGARPHPRQHPGLERRGSREPDLRGAALLGRPRARAAGADGRPAGAGGGAGLRRAAHAPRHGQPDPGGRGARCRRGGGAARAGLRGPVRQADRHRRPRRGAPGRGWWRATPSPRRRAGAGGGQGDARAPDGGGGGAAGRLPRARRAGGGGRGRSLGPPAGRLRPLAPPGRDHAEARSASGPSATGTRCGRSRRPWRNRTGARPDRQANPRA